MKYHDLNVNQKKKTEIESLEQFSVGFDCPLSYFQLSSILLDNDTRAFLAKMLKARSLLPIDLRMSTHWTWPEILEDVSEVFGPALECSRAAIFN